MEQSKRKAAKQRGQQLRKRDLERLADGIGVVRVSDVSRVKRGLRAALRADVVAATVASSEVLVDMSSVTSDWSGDSADGNVVRCGNEGVRDEGCGALRH